MPEVGGGIVSPAPSTQLAEQQGGGGGGEGGGKEKEN